MDPWERFRTQGLARYELSPFYREIGLSSLLASSSTTAMNTWKLSINSFHTTKHLNNGSLYEVSTFHVALLSYKTHNRKISAFVHCFIDSVYDSHGKRIIIIIQLNKALQFLNIATLLVLFTNVFAMNLITHSAKPYVRYTRFLYIALHSSVHLILVDP